MPYRSKNILICEAPLGKRANKILEPSSGGIGIKLNIPNMTFTRIMTLKNWPREINKFSSKGKKFKKRNKKPKIIAKAKLLNGPAAAINPPPFSGFLRFKGL